MPFASWFEASSLASSIALAIGSSGPGVLAPRHCIANKLAPIRPANATHGTVSLGLAAFFASPPVAFCDMLIGFRRCAPQTQLQGVEDQGVEDLCWLGWLR